MSHEQTGRARKGSATHSSSSVPPGGGNLDVPLSVWAASNDELPTALLSELAPKQGVVAFVGIEPGYVPASPDHPNHTLVVMADRYGAERACQLTGAGRPYVHSVTWENTANHLANMPDGLDTIITTGTWCRAEGFWTAASCALRYGGHVAVIAHASHPQVRESIHYRATLDGQTRLTNHIIAVATDDLDHAVTAETHLPTSNRRQCRAHRRVHTDVWVYRTRQAHV